MVDRVARAMQIGSTVRTDVRDAAMFDFLRAWAWLRRNPPPPGPARPVVVGTCSTSGVCTFADEVRRALARAHAHAVSGGHRALTPAHVALALLEGDDGPGPVLDRLGVDRAALRARLEPRRGRRRAPRDWNLQYDHAAKRSLEEAMAQTLELGRREVGPAHLLAGIVREGRSPAARTLASFGLTLPVLRAAFWPRYGGAE